MDNEMSALGGGRYRYSIYQTILLHLLLGIHLVFIPPGERGRNASLESFNALWQKWVFFHRCLNLWTAQRTSARFLCYHHFQKPSRSPPATKHATRFPGAFRDRLWPTLRHLPDGFSLDSYLDARGHLLLPIARGRVSYICKVDSNGRIDFNGAGYFIRRKLGKQYIVAALSTNHRQIFIRHKRKYVNTFPFPITGKVVKPLC